MDTTALLTDVLNAAIGAAKGHASDLQNYLEAHAKLITDGVAAIAADRLSGAMSDDDARFAFSQIQDSEATSVLAIEATSLAAAQDAINAALSVAAAAVNSAVGIAIL